MQQHDDKLQIQLTELTERWQENPHFFLTEALGVKPTKQQINASAKVGELIRAKLKYLKKKPLTPDEEELISKLGVSIMSGKGCHAKGTPMMLWDGRIRLVEDLKPGDKLVGDDGTPRVITSLARGHEAFYRLQFAWGECYDVNEGHILSLRCAGNHHKQHVKGALLDITVKEYLAWPRWKQQLYPMYKKPISHWKKPGKLPIPPYILGVWLGDGCKGRAQFACTDPEILAEIKDYAESIGCYVHSHNYKDHRISAPHGKPNPFLRALKQIGLTEDKFIPDQYLISDTKTRRELLAGLIDTDGWVDTRKKANQYGFVQKREVLAKQVQRLAQSLGHHCTLHPTKKSYNYKGERKTGVYYRLNIARGEIDKIPCRIVRKQLPHTNCKDLNFAFTVTPIEAQDFYGFSLTGNGRFLSPTGLVLHNTGKDAWASWMTLWFHCMFKNSKVIVTGPSRDQLRDVFMAETGKWANRTDQNNEYYFVLRDQIYMQADKIYSIDPERPDEEGKSWFVRLRTPPKNSSEEMQSKNMDGLHEDFMMVVVDEADGVAAPTITSLVTTLTKPVNFALMIFNPTKNYGYAYDSHFGNQAQYWIQLHWDSRDSENVDPITTDRVKETYGEESVEYRVNVLGLPPEQTSDTLIPKEWLDHAAEKDEYEPDKGTLRIMGVDPSRQGDDPAGIVIRDGMLIREFAEFKKLDTLELADQVAEIFIDWECDLMFIDCIGNGAGVYDVLKRRFPGKVRGVDVSTKPVDKRKKFHRLRDELWWKVREVFERRLITVPKHRLTKKFINELTIMRRDPMDESGGKIKIEGKGKMKSRGVKSPNLAEAFMVSLACPDAAYLTTTKTPASKIRDKYRESSKDIYEEFSRNWIVA